MPTMEGFEATKAIRSETRVSQTRKYRFLFSYKYY
jgi:hypothetical protein